MTPDPRAPWWRGRRGEWFVAAQVALIALVFLGPRTLPGWPAWPAALDRGFIVLGAVLTAVGLVLFLWGMLRLGSALTPLPYPKDGATLVRTGPYRVVRHPIYTGGILLAFGWALMARGWLTLIYAAVLFIFFDFKSAREERWLAEKFPDYPEYRKRVRKLIPFIY
jgi:protein-S-isoprenylcysteine O-methyltransferase Ste14